MSGTVNRPERFELFWLSEGEKKVTYTKDTKMPDAGTCRVLKEDHTLGNLLRMQLLRDQDVLFAGYKVPHPLEYEIVLKVRTKNTTTPIRAIRDATKSLTFEVDEIERQFREQLQQRGINDAADVPEYHMDVDQRFDYMH